MGELEKIDAKIEAIYEGQKAEKIRLNKFLDNQIGEKEMEDAKILNFPDELCELENAHSFGLIGNDQQLRKKIRETLKEESKKLCDQRKIAFILKELTGYDAEEEKENDAEKQEMTVKDAEGKQEIEMNEHQKYFNQKITELANEQKEKFQNRKALQVWGKQQ
jgi:translation elongation factor EF-1beta